jgi:hypothetical protein
MTYDVSKIMLNFPNSMATLSFPLYLEIASVVEAHAEE